MSKSATLMVLIGTLSIASPKPAQVAPPTPPEAIEIAKAIDADLELFEAAIKDKKEDEQIRLLDAVAKRFGLTTPKQRSRLRQGIDELLDRKVEKPRDRAIDVLGELRDPKGDKGDKETAASTKTLLRFAARRPVLEDVALHIRAIKAVGSLHHKSALEPLFERLSDKEVKIVVAAIQALGEYHEEKTTLKKDIFKTVLRCIPGERTGGGGGGRGGAGGNRPFNDPTFDRDRAQAIEGAADSTLARLTGVQQRGQAAWTQWWNDSGKRVERWGEK